MFSDIPESLSPEPKLSEQLSSLDLLKISQAENEADHLSRLIREKISED